MTVITFFYLIFSAFTTSDVDCISADEKKLYNLINEYRGTKSLSKIPMSAKLNAVAYAHAKDLVDNYDFEPNKRCNPHSWSKEGNWSSCCYTNDHKKAECMWQKPAEIADYNSSGYEILFYHSKEVEPEKALEGWKNSPSHNPVVVNSGIWERVTWNAMGVAIYENYASVWFGEAPDDTPINFCEE